MHFLIMGLDHGMFLEKYFHGDWVHMQAMFILGKLSHIDGILNC